MPKFRDMRNIAGFHKHHLIPKAVVHSRVFAVHFARLRVAGFEPEDFDLNGIYLPSTETNASLFRLPLHRGHHPRYNGAVAECIDSMGRLAPLDALVQTVALQRQLRVGLRASQATDIENLRFPMMTLKDFTTIERSAERLHRSLLAKRIG